MSNTYSVRTSRKVILRNILEEQRFVTAGNVVLHGRGAENYHFDRNQNLVYKLENFAGSPSPSDPLDGMLWWDTQNQSLMVYNEYGSPANAWQPVVAPGAGVGFSIVPGDGLEQVGSPVGRNYEPSGSPLTLELQVKTGGVGLQNIVIVNGASGAGMNDRIMTSLDGVTWTVRTRAAPSNTTPHYDVAYSPTLGRFVIVHYNQDVSYSDDGGVTWSYQSSALPVDATAGASNWGSIIWVDSLNLFIAGNMNNGSTPTNRFAYSADGLNWTLCTTTGPIVSTGNGQVRKFEDATATEGYVFAYCSSLSGGNVIIAFSSDGITWESRAVTTFGPSDLPQTAPVIPVGYSSDLRQIIGIENSGSNFSPPIIFRYELSTAGSPLFATADWVTTSATLGNTGLVWPDNGDYHEVFWIEPTQEWLIVGGGASNGSGPTGSPLPESLNFIRSTDGISYTRIGGVRPAATFPNQSYIVPWGNAIYIPSLGKILVTSHTPAGSPIRGQFFGQLADVTGYENKTQWSKVIHKDATWQASAVSYVWLHAAAGEATADGVTVAANSISVNPSEVSHDGLAGFVASEHTNHANVTVGGSGIGVNGGSTPLDLTATRTLFVNGGDGISESGSIISVDSSVVRTSGDVWSGVKTFTVPLQVGNGSAGFPSYSFYVDEDTGMYLIGAGNIGFATGGTLRLEISGGVLTANNTTYEILVTEDDDIPNKKYVDDAAASAGTGAVTQTVFTKKNTYTGSNVSTNRANTLSISGLTPGKKYLVGVYGIVRNNGTGSGVFGAVRITYNYPGGSVAPTSNVLYSGPTFSVNWPDGNFPQHSMAVITAPASGQIWGWCDYRTGGGTPTEWLSAYQMTAVQLD